MKTNPPANSNKPTSRKKPRIIAHPPFATPSAITGLHAEIQPRQSLISPPGPHCRRHEQGAKALTLRPPASIRAAMAAGAIPPPLFFGQRRHFLRSAPCHGSLKETSRTNRYSPHTA